MYEGDIETAEVLRQLARESPTVLWSMTADWEELLFITDDYGDLWGRPRSALVEDPTDFLNGIHPDDRATAIESRERAKAGEPAEIEIRVDPTAEFDRWARVRSVPIHEDGEHTRTAGFAREITERREYRRQLEAVNDQLERFADVVAHDLRNPLSVASGSVELAREEEDHRALSMASDAIERMETLVDEVLESAATQGAVADAEAIELSSFAVEHWRYVPTEEARLTIETDRKVRADRELLSRLFENLFSNAVEHGSTSSQPEADDAVEHGSTSPRPRDEDAVEHGSTSSRTGSDGVTITVGATDRGFYIADDGPGLPGGGDRDVLAEGFAGDDGGTGLGLAIVKRITDAHGWDVEVGESTAGGARFDFVLPEDGGRVTD
jgi:signal transduction histidine kinase